MRSRILFNRYTLYLAECGSIHHLKWCAYALYSLLLAANKRFAPLFILFSFYKRPAAIQISQADAFATAVASAAGTILNLSFHLFPSHANIYIRPYYIYKPQKILLCAQCATESASARCALAFLMGQQPTGLSQLASRCYIKKKKKYY